MIRTKFLLAFTGFIFFSLLSWHCTKIDTTNLGGGLIPAVDNVNTFDTLLNVIGNNIDSTILGKGCATVYPTDEHALGYISNDPLFGTTKATIYTELKPATFPFTFQGKPADRTLDSVVLVLSYKRTYGDTTLPQRVEVHEITGTFNPDSSSCSAYPFNIPVLGSATYVPRRLADSIKTFRDTTTNQLRIKLNYGLSLLAQDTIKTDSAFKSFLKGFAIVPDNMGNALTYYSITDTRTKLAVYYKYKRTNLSDTMVVTNFSLYNGDHSANNIVRNRNGAEINNSSNAASNPNGDNFIYIQTTPGAFAQLKIPGLTGLSNRIIHRAELIIEQAPPAPLDNILTAPPFLFLDLKDSANGAYHPVPCDFNVIQGQPDIGTFGGFRTNAKNASGNAIARYTFNISRYVQKIITNKKIVPNLRLSAPNYATNPVGYFDECNNAVPPLLLPLNNVAEGRVKLVGGNINSTSPNRLRLRIIYSRL